MIQYRYFFENMMSKPRVKLSFLCLPHLNINGNYNISSRINFLAWKQNGLIMAFKHPVINDINHTIQMFINN